MNSRKDILLAQMDVCHHEKTWFAPLDIALKGLTLEQASWRDERLNISILEIVNHLIFWNERCLNEFKGIPVSQTEFDNDSTFRNIDKDWQSTVQHLHNVLSEWRETLAEYDEGKLDTLDSEKPWWVHISNLILHNAHHIGQIIHVRKLQGTWEKIEW
jgi:uncharacterized damage-inducible protein DinB